MDLYNFILVIKSDFPPVLLSRQHYQFLHLQKIINYAPSRKCECGIPSCQPRAAGSTRWDTSSCLPATHPIVMVTVRRSAFQITNQYSPPEGCAVPPGQEGAGGDGQGQICSAASLLLPPHPAGWTLAGGVPVGPRSAGQWLSLFPGLGCALAPNSPPPPEVWAAKHPS